MGRLPPEQKNLLDLKKKLTEAEQEYENLAIDIRTWTAELVRMRKKINRLRADVQIAEDKLRSRPPLS